MAPHSLQFVLCLTLLGATPVPSAPWNDSGHRIVSLLAWPQLSPAAQQGVTELLRQHPRYEADLLLELPRDSNELATARLAFARAANWPDTVRSVSHPLHKVAHHSKWHYIDIPFQLENQPVPTPSGEGATAGDPKDIVEAIAKCRADLGNDKLAATDRAMALCWLIHLVEDIHQPLHACTLYSPQFPKGDRGGNSFLITRNVFDPDSRTNLHSLWDSLLGNYRSADWDACVATGLAARPPMSEQQLAPFLAEHEPMAWARESHELAIEYVYQHGKLAGEAAGTAVSGTPAKAPPLPNDYLRAGEQIAMQRAAIAAGRLARLLNEIFAPK
jgi:hypothetical protein